MKGIQLKGGGCDDKSCLPKDMKTPYGIINDYINDNFNSVS